VPKCEWLIWRSGEVSSSRNHEITKSYFTARFTLHEIRGTLKVRCAIIHYHELALKGRNRDVFEQQLLRNIREALRDLGVGRVEALQGRLKVSLPDEVPPASVGERLGRVFGISNFLLTEAVPLHLTQPDLETYLNMSAFVGRSKPEVLDNLVQAALRVQSRHPGQAHFLLVLRSDGEPVLEERKRAFRASAVAMGIPVYDENANAGRALAAMQAHELYLSARNAPAGGDRQHR